LKIKKAKLKAMLAECAEAENCAMQEVGPEALCSLIGEVLKYRKLRKRLRELRTECDFLRDYVEGNGGGAGIHPDRLEKHEHAIQEAAITAFLGNGFWKVLNEKLI